MKQSFRYILLIFLGAVFLQSCHDKQAQPQQTGERNAKANNVMVAADVAGAGTGSIRGRAVFEGKVPAPQKLLVVKDVQICGKREHLDERLLVSADMGIRNVVISLNGVQQSKPATIPGREFVLDQNGCAYQPHVVIVPVGVPVQILNNDGILHNIHTFSTRNAPVNLAQPKFMKKLELAFSMPERVAVKCDIHGWMSAWIVAVDHPYHVLSDEDGNFVLTDIPPGTYTISSWHELLGERTAEVTVVAGREMVLDFAYTGK